MSHPFFRSSSQFALFLLLFGSRVHAASERPRLVSGSYTGGLIRKAVSRAAARHLAPPFSDPKFILSDVTFEYKRRFVRYSGDISGRYLSAAAFLFSPHPFRSVPALGEILAGIEKAQKPDGHFGVEQDLASEVNQSRDMPLVWGNGRLLVGLLDIYHVSDRKDALPSARRLGDYFLATEKFYGRKENFSRVGGAYSSGFATCYFSLIEGLQLLGREPGGEKHRRLAERIGKLLREGPDFKGFHAHGRLTAYRGLLLSGAEDDLKFVLDRWKRIVNEGYVTPNGAVGEVFRTRPARDEGCAEADWLRLNLMLFRRTGKVDFLDAAENVILNEIFATRFPNGGFGHHKFLYETPENGSETKSESESPPVGFRAGGAEAYWCCSSHVARALGELLENPWIETRDAFCLPFLFPARARIEKEGVEIDLSLVKKDDRPSVAGEWQVKIAAGRPLEFQVLLRRPRGCRVEGAETDREPVGTGGWIRLPFPLRSGTLSFRVVPGFSLGREGRDPMYGPYRLFLPQPETGFGLKSPPPPRVFPPNEAPEARWEKGEPVWFDVPLALSDDGRPYLELKTSAAGRPTAFLLLPWRCNEGGFFRFKKAEEKIRPRRGVFYRTTPQRRPEKYLVFYSTGPSDVFVNGKRVFSYAGPDEAYRFPLPQGTKELAVVTRSGKKTPKGIAAYVEEVDWSSAGRRIALATGKGAFRVAEGAGREMTWCTSPPSGPEWRQPRITGWFGDEVFRRTAGALADTGACWIWHEKNVPDVRFRATLP